MNPRAKGILIVILAIVALFFLARISRKTQIASSANNAATLAEDSSTPGSGGANIVTSEAGNPTIAQEQARELVDLAPVDIVRDEHGNLSVSISLKLSSVCFPGDLDVMQKVFANDASLIFAIEPMDSSLGSAYVRNISPDEIRKGLSFRAPISLEKTAVWSLAICGDKAGKKTCLGKSAVDFNKTFAGQDAAAALNGLYYFHFAVLGQNLQSVYTGLAEGAPALKQHLKEKEGLREPPLLKQVDRAFAQMRAIQSVPPYTSRSGDVLWIEIPVAGLDPLACRK